ncbi:hypothetical protein M501DRAFT_992146 [Patellaria atrata CBS 101060]|uniref:DUF7703 domain-containing protein n=1 Tax=Patellaria atrata CBS 101060 TaxID=1346257 RepID=A0A9P4SAR0_9PEZI|nr:hypothetical protein M501DRAFT_992146 [Patellaria atrata CBS 101060]
MSATTTAALSMGTHSPQGDSSSAAAGITGGYTGDSLTLKILIAVFIGLSLYNAVELVTLSLVTFKRYRGKYFWSLMASTLGIIPYAIGFLLKFYQIIDPLSPSHWGSVFLLSIGWYPMVTGQALVLWSRLHLVVRNEKVLRWTLYMIITNAIVLHIPTTVLTCGSNSNSLRPSTHHAFVHGYNIMEKTQMTGFATQELIISFIYVREAIRLLRLSTAIQEEDRVGRKIMFQLLGINVVIIILDIALLAVAYANLYVLETTLKGVVYSVKLKLEFAVLGKLIYIVKTRSNTGSDKFGPSVSTLNKEVSYRTDLDFIDTSRPMDGLTHAEGSMNASASGSSRRPSTRPTTSGHKTERSWIDEEMDKHNLGHVDDV